MSALHLSKKHNMILITGGIFLVMILAAVTVFIPLYTRHRELTGEFVRLQRQTREARDFIGRWEGAETGAGLIGEDQVVNAIDEITQAGNDAHVYFVSINPGEIENADGVPYRRLPIEFHVISEYKNLGLFLGSLRGLTGCVAFIKNFEVTRDEAVLPMVPAAITIEVYLKDG